MEDKKTFQLAADLRDFADFLEEHGLILPDVTVDLRSYLWNYTSTDIEDVQGTVALAMRAGMKSADEVKKDYSSDYFRLFLHFGKLRYKLVCNREEVCTKRVVGTETVTKQMPPEGEWTEKIVEQDIVEWDCNPLLAVVTDRDTA
jgi:hypothetical protein